MNEKSFRILFKSIISLIVLGFAYAIIYEFTKMSDETARNYFIAVLWILCVAGFAFAMKVIWEK